jgi:hypothetical protein
MMSRDGSLDADFPLIAREMPHFNHASHCRCQPGIFKPFEVVGHPQDRQVFEDGPMVSQRASMVSRSLGGR